MELWQPAHNLSPLVTLLRAQTSCQIKGHWLLRALYFLFSSRYIITKVCLGMAAPSLEQSQTHLPLIPLHIGGQDPPP